MDSQTAKTVPTDTKSIDSSLDSRYHSLTAITPLTPLTDISPPTQLSTSSTLSPTSSTSTQFSAPSSCTTPSSSFSSSPELDHYRPKARHSSIDIDDTPTHHSSATSRLRHSISLTRATRTVSYSEYTDDIYDFINEICTREQRSKVSVLREVIGNQLRAGSESELLGNILEDADIVDRDCYRFIQTPNK